MVRGPQGPQQMGKRGVAGPSSGEPATLGVSPDSSTCAVEVERAGAPRQRVLEGVEEVPEHPGQDRVVVQADQEGHGEAAQPCGHRARSTPPWAARWTPSHPARVSAPRIRLRPLLPARSSTLLAGPQRPVCQPRSACRWAFGQPEATRRATGLPATLGLSAAEPTSRALGEPGLPSAQPPQVPQGPGSRALRAPRARTGHHGPASCCSGADPWLCCHT